MPVGIDIVQTRRRELSADGDPHEQVSPPNRSQGQDHRDPRLEEGPINGIDPLNPDIVQYP